MGINNNKFRFGTIAGIRPRIAFPFPCFNHLKYVPGLPEAIEKLNNKIISGNRCKDLQLGSAPNSCGKVGNKLKEKVRLQPLPTAKIMELNRLEFNLRLLDFWLWIIFVKFGRFTSPYYASQVSVYVNIVFFYSLYISSVIKIIKLKETS